MHPKLSNHLSSFDARITFGCTNENSVAESFFSTPEGIDPLLSGLFFGGPSRHWPLSGPVNVVNAYFLILPAVRATLFTILGRNID